MRGPGSRKPTTKSVNYPALKWRGRDAPIVASVGTRRAELEITDATSDKDIEVLVGAAFAITTNRPRSQRG